MTDPDPAELVAQLERQLADARRMAGISATQRIYAAASDAARSYVPPAEALQHLTRAYADHDAETEDDDGTLVSWPSDQPDQQQWPVGPDVVDDLRTQWQHGTQDQRRRLFAIWPGLYQSLRAAFTPPS